MYDCISTYARVQCAKRVAVKRVAVAVAVTVTVTVTMTVAVTGCDWL